MGLARAVVSATKARRANGTDACSLHEVLQRLASAGDDECVSVSDIVDAIGPRSFGPLLLVPALIVMSPLSGIRGLSTVMGITIALVSGQMLVGRRVAWLPAIQRLYRLSRLRSIHAFPCDDADLAIAFQMRRFDFLR